MTSTIDPNPDVLRDRPFYFMMNVWGDEFRWMFLNLCLASLLSPRNIPSLVNKRGSRFVIVAPREDLDVIERSPLAAQLREHIGMELIEIPDPNALSPNLRPPNYNYLINTRSYKLAADLAYKNGAYGCYLCPDTLLSDGSVAYLQKRALGGANVVLAAALRHDQDSFLTELTNSKAVELGKPLCFKARDLVELSMRHWHPQVTAHDWDSDRFTLNPGFCLWRIRGSNGMVLHSMRWAPLLINYAALTEHRVESRFGGGGTVAMDDDYIYCNFGAGDGIELVTDTDSIAYVSLTPATGALAAETTSNNFSKCISLRISAHGMDPLQSKLFRQHVRIHPGPIDKTWHDREREIDGILDQCLKRPPTAFDRLWHRFGAAGLRRLAERILARLRRHLGAN